MADLLPLQSPPPRRSAPPPPTASITGLNVSNRLESTDSRSSVEKVSFQSAHAYLSGQAPLEPPAGSELNSVVRKLRERTRSSRLGAGSSVSSSFSMEELQTPDLNESNSMVAPPVFTNPLAGYANPFDENLGKKLVSTQPALPPVYSGSIITQPYHGKQEYYEGDDFAPRRQRSLAVNGVIGTLQAPLTLPGTSVPVSPPFHPTAPPSRPHSMTISPSTLAAPTERNTRSNSVPTTTASTSVKSEQAYVLPLATFTNLAEVGNSPSPSVPSLPPPPPPPQVTPSTQLPPQQQSSFLSAARINFHSTSSTSPVLLPTFSAALSSAAPIPPTRSDASLGGILETIEEQMHSMEQFVRQMSIKLGDAQHELERMRHNPDSFMRDRREMGPITSKDRAKAIQALDHTVDRMDATVNHVSQTFKHDVDKLVSSMRAVRSVVQPLDGEPDPPPPRRRSYSPGSTRRRSKSPASRTKVSDE